MVDKFTQNFVVTDDFLKNNKNICFVYGSSKYGKGYGGAAQLRDNSNTYPFITKIRPNNENESFYIPEEYLPIYYVEMIKLKEFLKATNFDKVLISKIGGGLANKYGIFEQVIEPRIKKDLAEFGDKIVYLF